MQISTRAIRELANDTIEPLATFAGLLEVYELDSKKGLHSAQSRKNSLRSTRTVIQAIKDLRLLASCDDKPDTYDSINWKKLIHENLPDSGPGHLSEFLTWEGDEENYAGAGYSDLVAEAAQNMKWFNKQFWNSSAKVRLSLVEREGRPWIDCVWDFGASIVVDPKFASFDPFHDLFPTKSVALDQSTGLALWAVKQVLALHGGDMIAHCGEKNLKLEWLCPKSNQA